MGTFAKALLPTNWNS